MADRMAEDRYPERFDENRHDWDRRLRAHADGEGSQAERAALDAWLRRDPSAMARYRELGGATRDYHDEYSSHERSPVNSWRDDAPPPRESVGSDLNDDPFAEASRPSTARRHRRDVSPNGEAWSGEAAGGAGWRDEAWDRAGGAERPAAGLSPDRGEWPAPNPDADQRRNAPQATRAEEERYEDYRANVNRARSEATSTSAHPPPPVNGWSDGTYPSNEPPRASGADPLSAVKAARTAYGPSERGFSLPPLERDQGPSAAPPPPPPPYGADRSEWSRGAEPPARSNPEPRYQAPPPLPPLGPAPHSAPPDPAYSSTRGAPPPVAPIEGDLRSDDYRPAAYESDDFRADAGRPEPPRASARGAQARRPVLGSVAAAARTPAPANSSRPTTPPRDSSVSPKPGPSARPERRAPTPPTPDLQETRAPRAEKRPSVDRRQARQPARPAVRPEPVDEPFQAPHQAPSPDKPSARRPVPQSKQAAPPRPAPAQRAKGGAASTKTTAKPQQARAKGPAPKEPQRSAKPAPNSNAENVTAALRKETKPPHRAPARLGFATALVAFAALAFGFYLGVALGGGGGGGALDWRDRVAVSAGLKIPENFALRQTPPTATRAAVQKLGALLELDLSIAADPPVGLSLQEVSHLRYNDVELANIDYLDAAGAVLSLAVARRTDSPALDEKLSYDTLSLAGHTGVEWRSDTHVFLLVGAASSEDIRRFAYVFGKELN
ncbi:MAG: hypothetical protein KTR21_13420 [Rhodobacteraceae bacterium]|nr:hypothetical protein [Paracoccaceae bacterium]